MKRALTLLAPAALAACLACPPALAQAAAPVSPVPAAVSSAAQQFTLKNGMQLIVQPDRRAPTAVHMVWVRVGAMDEVDGTSGVAHALEHMMFKGSKRLRPGEFSRRVAALGGQENAFTSWDYTGYYQQIPASRLQEVMQLEADRFAHNQWPDAEFTKEIEVIKEERRMRTEDNPRALLMEQLYAASYVAFPYHRPIIGWMGDLDALTPDDVRAFHRQWYVPGNAVVVVAGDVDAAQVRAWAEKTYGSIAARALPVRKPRPEPVQRGIRRVEVKAPAEQAYVALAFHVPRIARVDEVVKNELGGVVELRGWLDPESRPGMEGANRKVKGTIHWVSARHAAEAEIRLYDRLFSVEKPDDESDGKTYRDHLNPASKKIVTGYVEPAAAQAVPEQSFQFERLGYFVADRRDHSPERPVFNRSVTLRDTWAK